MKIELHTAFLAAVGLMAIHGPASRFRFAGPIDVFFETVGAEFAGKEDILTNDRQGQFVWSDTPWLGLGNSTDRDPANLLKWMDNYASLTDTEEKAMELAFFDRDAGEAGMVIYYSVGYPQ